MPKKILIVDDEEEILVLLKRRLEKLEYSVITADTGLDGLAVAQKETPDLLILDVMLPGLDGYQICRLLKFDTEHQNIKIILLTARDDQPDKDIGKDVKADAYITKPFDPDKLTSTVKDLLGD